MKELFISDLLQTLTHQHFCSAMQKLRIPIRLMFLLLLPVSFVDFYSASTTLPPFHDLHFRDKTAAISRETLHTGNCDFPCQDFMQSSISQSFLSPKSLHLQDQNYRQGHRRSLERKIERKQE